MRRFAVLLLLSISSSAAEPRKALLIGNGAYRNLTPLEQPVNDVRRLATSFARAGFLVQTLEDATSMRQDQEIRRFSQSLQPGDAALLYYSGHAVQLDGENYLIPVDFKADSDVNVAAYSVSRVNESDLGARRLSLSMLILDAGRQERSLSARFPDPGLALMETGKSGVVIAFAAGPRQLVRPGGAFARSLEAAIAKPGLELPQVLEEVKRAVSAATMGEQIPVYVSSVVNDFHFIDKPSDKDHWDRIRDTADRKALEDFRAQFPASPYAADALKRIEQMLAEERARLSGEERVRQLAESRRLISETIARFVAGYRQRDLQKLMEVWPAMGRDRARSLQDFFKSPQSQKLNYDVTVVGEPLIDGDSATVRCQQLIQMAGQSPNKSFIEIRFKKSGSAMSIEALNVVK